MRKINSFYGLYFLTMSKTFLPNPRSQRFSDMFSSGIFIGLFFKNQPIIHFVLILYKVWYKVQVSFLAIWGLNIHFLKDSQGKKKILLGITYMWVLKKKSQSQKHRVKKCLSGHGGGGTRKRLVKRHKLFS